MLLCLPARGSHFVGKSWLVWSFTRSTWFNSLRSVRCEQFVTKKLVFHFNRTRAHRPLKIVCTRRRAPNWTFRLQLATRITNLIRARRRVVPRKTAGRTHFIHVMYMIFILRAYRGGALVRRKAIWAFPCYLRFSVPRGNRSWPRRRQTSLSAPRSLISTGLKSTPALWLRAVNYFCESRLMCDQNELAA